MSIAETVDQKYLSVTQAANYLGCSERFIYRLISAGDLESSHLHGRRLLTREAIDKMVQSTATKRPRRGRGRMSPETRRAAAQKGMATKAARAGLHTT